MPAETTVSLYDLDPARYDYWNKRDILTIYELAFLLKGRQPPPPEFDSFTCHADFRVFFDELNGFAEDLSATRSIKPLHNTGGRPMWIGYPIRELLGYLKTKGYRIPVELKPPRVGNLDPLRRPNATMILQGLCTAYDVNLSKPYQAAKRIRLVIGEENISENTIVEFLKKIKPEI